MIKFLSDMDRWLLSNIYQPLTNTARKHLGINAHFLSAMAASFMALTVVLDIIGDVLPAISKINGMSALNAFLDLWWLYICTGQVIRQVRLARRLNEEDVLGRHALRSAEVLRGGMERIYWIIMISVLIAIDAISGSTLDFIELGFVFWMSSLYLAACMTPPRSTRKQGAGNLSTIGATGKA